MQRPKSSGSIALSSARSSVAVKRKCTPTYTVTLGWAVALVASDAMTLCAATFAW